MDFYIEIIKSININIRLFNYVLIMNSVKIMEELLLDKNIFVH